ncbi:MAG TPA: rhodanese-like domain-containing protein [Candidatus Dormibacteraeota bacterium]|jgi:rhodanese-related sulfurtransferase/quercetin dioxygenase-like cupin family protein|nr:rhodanese-like domain-containing protein [Candidatus Dormibacteraeota bacterium]
MATSTLPASFLHPLIPTDSALARDLVLPRATGPAALAALAARIADEAGPALRSIARHDPERRWYARLALSADVEAWLIGWAPGQGTPAHDHGEASGALHVLEGTLREERRSGRGPVERVLLGAGQTSAFGPDRIHAVSNAGDVVATSVHVYSPPLMPMRRLPSIDALLEPIGAPPPAEANGIDRLLDEARVDLPRVGPEVAAEARDRGAVLVDIRPAGERAAEGVIPGAVAIERNVLEWRLDPSSPARLPFASYDLDVIVLCTEGYASTFATLALRRLGVRASDLDGGFRAWRAAGLPVHVPDQPEPLVTGA